MSIDGEDGEPCSVHETEIRKARKKHTCNACGRDIQPGHHYARVFVVWDGNREITKRCGSCQLTWVHLAELCTKRNLESGGCLYPDGALNCGLKYADEWDGEPPEEIVRLPFLTDEEAGALLVGRC